MLSKIIPEAGRFISTVAQYRMNPFAGARRYLHLYGRRRFSPNEIHFLNLLDPQLSQQALEAMVSKEELLQVQHRLNEHRHFALTEDKIAFAIHCLAAGLPAPQVHAVYDVQERPCGSLRVLRDEKSLAAFLRGHGADDLIVKPVEGVHGEGVMRLARCEGAWRLSDGRQATAAVLLGAFGSSGYRRWMFQELVRGHPGLNRLSGAEGLQTLRIVTLIEPGGKVRVLAGRLRLICNDGVQDNFDFGRTGNLVANLDLESGRVRNVVGRDPDRRSMRGVERHPRTGHQLIGYEIPQWREAKALALAAADAFRPLRTIGWDVAVTPERPCLIEGNVTWDTLIGEPRMGAIYSELRRLAGLG